MPEQPSALGHHWVMDLYGCPIEFLDDPALIQRRLQETTERFGLTLLKLATNRFEPQGVTAIGLLAESHLSIHTWPEHNYAAIDIFTCGSDEALQAACEFIAEVLGAERSTVMRLRRGVLKGVERCRIEAEVIT